MHAKLAILSWVSGVAGALTCVVGMVMAIAGVSASAATTGMASMRAHGGMDVAESSGVVGWLGDIGPWMLTGSIGAVAFGAFAKRRSAVLPALIGGGVLYVGLYEQDSVAVMYWAMGIGFVLWAITWIWVIGRLPRAVIFSAPNGRRLRPNEPRGAPGARDPDLCLVSGNERGEPHRPAQRVRGAREEVRLLSR